MPAHIESFKKFAQPEKRADDQLKVDPGAKGWVYCLDGETLGVLKAVVKKVNDQGETHDSRRKGFQSHPLLCTVFSSVVCAWRSEHGSWLCGVIPIPYTFIYLGIPHPIVKILRRKKRLRKFHDFF